MMGRPKSRSIPPFARMAKTYEGLCRMFLPRPIRDEVDHDNTMEVIDAMAGHDLNDDQEDYLDLLATLVSEYDRAHHTMDLSHLTPRDRLKALCDDRGMTAVELGNLVGDHAAGDQLLKGEREPSKSEIRTLAAHFRVDPGFFF